VLANRKLEAAFDDGGLFQANVKKCLTMGALRDQLCCSSRPVQSVLHTGLGCRLCCGGTAAGMVMCMCT